MNAFPYINKNFNKECCINAMIDGNSHSSVMRDLVVLNLINKRDNFLVD